jgi:hypothetical protein
VNINDYTGLPYNFRTRNCWHHVRNVRADAGLETPRFDVISPSQIQDAFDNGHAAPKGLEQVFEPKDFDAVLMCCRMAGRLIWHAGVYYQGFVSHCELAARQVRLESLSDLKQRYHLIEFWR